MLKYLTYELVQNDNGTWDCYTWDVESNAFDYDDFTGVGLSAAEAYQDWLDSNSIVIDGNGRHTYSISLE